MLHRRTPLLQAAQLPGNPDECTMRHAGRHVHAAPLTGCSRTVVASGGRQSGKGTEEDVRAAGRSAEYFMKVRANLQCNGYLGPHLKSMGCTRRVGVRAGWVER